jgi:glycosyltransferase involved in cell wall biosynthesis
MRTGLSAFNAVVLAPCKFDLDPRHQYWFDSLTKIGLNVLKVEVLDSIDELGIARSCQLSGDLLSVGSNRQMSDTEIREWFGVCDVPAVTPVGRFLKSRLSRTLHAILQEELVELQPCVVIANDLLGMILADKLWGSSKSKLIYDAQEIFTESYDLLPGPKLNGAERKGWINLETAVCTSADLVVTVSPGIADFYKSRHMVDCEVIPNFVPLGHSKRRSKGTAENPVKFVVIGRADPYRGLENLVKSWDFSSDIARLDLIMPDTRQRRALERVSSSVERQHGGPNFRSPVRPDEIVAVLASYDVGIIPYDYPYPLSHASPNKFGEYVAAGLAVLTNSQPFVRQQVEHHQIGRVFSWGIDNDFQSQVGELLNPEVLRIALENSMEAFTESLNWESSGSGVWVLINEAVTECLNTATENRPHPIDFEVTENANRLEKLHWRLRRKGLLVAQSLLSIMQVLRK